jgi:predicted ATPase
MTLPTGGLITAEILWDTVPDREAFPFSIPAIRALDTVDLSDAVTFFVGENGSGKSTLLEAIAIAAGLNPEGATRNLRFASRPTESSLHDHLRLVWRTRQRWAFFLRAETFFNTTSAYERVSEGGELHNQSHGEQFIEAAMSKFEPGGFHLMDEPEAALSVLGQLKLLRRVHDVVGQGGQFVVATHSPILLAFPGARIYEFSDGLRQVEYTNTEPYTLTRSFLEAPERFLKHLFADEDEVEPG